ncbi:MAG: hypothetical protein ACR2N0_11390 [Rubrobacteraceae bacterium]
MLDVLGGGLAPNNVIKLGRENLLSGDLDSPVNNRSVRQATV